MKRITMVMALLLLFSTLAYSQDSSAASRQPDSDSKPADSTKSVDATKTSDIDVLYTGKLLGYFRVPSKQLLEPFKGCKTTSKTDDSPAAIKFLEKRFQNSAAILVGTGDNFAPELEARIFSDSDVSAKKGSAYKVGNKELFFGDNNNSWVFYDSVPDSLRTTIANGFGTIPTDNVGCFLRAARYSAIVPGKHDFYYGAERVREFARLLADKSINGQPVQMLGANLVLKTSEINSTAGSSEITDKLWFKEWSSDISVSNLSDNKVVYPWFSYVKLQLIDYEKNDELVKNLNNQFKLGYTDLSSFIAYLKTASIPVDDKVRQKLQKNSEEATSLKLHKSKGRPNELDENSDEPLVTPVVRWNNTKITLTVALSPKHTGKDNHFSTLTFATNYGLCINHDDEDPSKKGIGCMRFSVHTPLFYYPHTVPGEKNDGFDDPVPYVLDKNQNVAIFGVVDPSVADQIGVINLGWQNTNPKLNTRVSIEDPSEALKEQLDYFQLKEGKFDGLKILLVQATPQRAKAFGAKFPEFQIVVSAADQDQGTSESDISTNWKSDRPSSFLAVPTPYFDTNEREGAIHLGRLKAIPSNQDWIIGTNQIAADPVEQPKDPAKKFWGLVRDKVGGTPSKGVQPICTPQGFQTLNTEVIKDQTYLKWLVLCAMRNETKADVALIQKRDLFDQIPNLAKSNYLLPSRNPKNQKPFSTDADAPENIQQVLDRLIWKGDLLTLLYIPGSSLKAALKQSEAFANDESSTFALAVERGRQLEKLGVFKNDGGDYVVNGVPLDDNKVYAVATTDYIGAGDTGYPDLVKSALNPRLYPAAFTGELLPISSIVCKLLLDADHCLNSINSQEYLDQSSASMTPTYERDNWVKRKLGASGISWPNANVDPTSTSDNIEQKVQRRAIWLFSLKQLSFSISDLDNNSTDQDVKNRFGGITTSGVNSKGSHETTVSGDARLSYSGYKNEFFINGTIDYDLKLTGEPDPGKKPVDSLDKNKITGDIGYIYWWRPGRADKRLGWVFALHGESQVKRPFFDYDLGDGSDEKLRIHQDRSLLLTFRNGARWQSKQNYFEVGGQIGRELRALRGYRFDPPGEPIFCKVISDKPLATCIKNSSTPPMPVTLSTPYKVLQMGHPRAGLYWTHGYTIPFTSKMNYSVTQDADFFFIEFDSDTNADTRFRYNSTNSLDFKIFPSVSIGPKLDLFMYQNKDNRDFLFQYTIGFTTKISFDLFNRRERMTQITHGK